MNTPLGYYEQELEKYKQESAKLYKTLAALSTFRLLTFLGTGFSVYLTFNSWQVAVVVAILGIGLFLFLLSKYTNIKGQRTIVKALISINESEIKIASGEFHDREQGLEYQDPNHFFSLDIDLFGRGSFFQFLNRTFIKEGTLKLANELKANNIQNIESRQAAIKELSEKPEWRQQFSATASLIKVETPAASIIDWLKNHKSFLPGAIKWLTPVFGLLSLTIFTLAFFKIVDLSIIGAWLFFGIILTGRFIKKTNILASNTDKVKDTFRQYALLLSKIENESFASELLQQKQQQIKSENIEASAIFSELSRAIDALDNRNNLIAAIFGNGFFLTDIKNAYKVEQWISKYGDKVQDWFEVVSFFDAYNSLGNYDFNHPEFVYPLITKEDSVINAKGLGHPLLDAKKRVDSDVIINDRQFFIVTGANMAGKSTFLRSISLHIVMANVGLPVCARSSNYTPVKLITSMRTDDSLTDDSSYFFSELTRLKFIVEAIKKESYFIILDEILKGTNSTDKAIGSRKFVEKLVASKATGIIATHDLSLCEIEDEFEEVRNHYFDAEIINDELHFDYTFKKGICQNMNASFLLKKMEIV